MTSERAEALDLLRTAVADDRATFREGQWEAIDALVNRRERMLVVERTGWGKSAVYFIATRLLRDSGRGPTLIVSPLLALMRNQIEAAKRLGIDALTINSTNRDEWATIGRAVLAADTDALLISPERLANDDFVKSLLLPMAENIGLLVVDEAHCISDWGHDFRPDYRRLTNVLRSMPANIPILGTTATANDRVVEDVQAQLGDIGIQRGSLMRESLSLQTIRLPTQAARLAWLGEHIDTLPGTGIIYTLTKRDADRIADWLDRRAVTARAYYSGVVDDGFEDTNTYRLHLEDELRNNRIKALVATTALGMGYDKPDLGFVVHYQSPDSVVSYYQQVGRAGRGIARAYGILLSGQEDSEIHEYFRDSAFPPEQWVELVLQTLDDSDGLSVFQLEERINLRRRQIEHVLKFLSVDSPSPVIKDGPHWLRTPTAYHMDHIRIRRLTEQRLREWHEVQAYIDEKGCLMQFLARALDEAQPQPCGKCASCLGAPVIEPAFTNAGVVSATRFLRHAEFALECPVLVPKDAFPKYEFRGWLQQELRTETGRILSRWGDAGWGRMVADDKRDGRFRDTLVDAVAEMIQDRWQPAPAPTWITCVPSHNRPTLVADFANRLADALTLPFRPVVMKVKQNEAQKIQKNRYHQCRNLDGVFAIRGEMSDRPVLLIDDVVDSKWTITVVSALLRRAGSGAVFPLALATSNMGA